MLKIFAWIFAVQAMQGFPIQGTFLNFYRDLSPEQWRQEFQDMREVDIKTVVVLSIGRLRSDPADPQGFSPAPEGFIYPSRYLTLREDRLELILSLADHQGMHVLLGSLQTETDWTDGTEFAALRTWNRRVAAEILQRYGQHPSLQGWYFTQELWMNWIKYYGVEYYGTTLLANWIADLKTLDSAKITTASVVFKQSPSGPMPGLKASELKKWTTHFLKAAPLDILMPQDGIGARSGAPSLNDLPAYYKSISRGIRAAHTNTALWDTIETFTSRAGLRGDQYPPANATRIQKQVTAVRPYVTGYVSWIFGDDMSPQATYYSAEANELNRQYQSLFHSQTR
jgi:hypothetical protein